MVADLRRCQAGRHARNSRRPDKKHGVKKLTKEERTAVQVLCKRGKSYTWIAQQLGLTVNSVQRWAPRKTVATQKKVRPRIVDPQEARKYCVNQRFASAQQARALFLNPATGKMVARSTVTRALAKAGTVSRRVLRTPMLTAASKEKRLKFCADHANENWHDWCWTDEKLFKLGGTKGRERIWVDEDNQHPDERYVGKVQHPVSTMVWGCVTYDGRSSLHFHDTHVDAAVYIDCLKEAFLTCKYDPEYMNLKKTKKYIFMQDGAPCHTAKRTQQFCKSRFPKHIKVLERGEWPPSSPDFNPIEKLWNVLQDRVVGQMARTETEQIAIIEREWWAIPQDLIRRLIDSMPRRIERCHAAQGGRFEL